MFKRDKHTAEASLTMLLLHSLYFVLSFYITNVLLLNVYLSFNKALYIEVHLLLYM